MKWLQYLFPKFVDESHNILILVNLLVCLKLNLDSDYICLFQRDFQLKCNFQNIYILIKQGGTKCWSVAATLHENLSFGRKSWPPTYAVLSQNQLCCKLCALIVWFSWPTTYTVLSRNHLCCELRTGFLTEIIVSDFHLRFLSEIFVWDFFSELGWKEVLGETKSSTWHFYHTDLSKTVKG